MEGDPQRVRAAVLGRRDHLLPVWAGGQRCPGCQHRVVGLAQVRGEQADHVRGGRVRGHLVHRPGGVGQPALAAEAGQLGQEERRIVEWHGAVVTAHRPAMHAGGRASDTSTMTWAHTSRIVQQAAAAVNNETGRKLRPPLGHPRKLGR